MASICEGRQIIHIYPTYSKKYNDKSSNIDFLKFKKLSKIEWLQLNDFKSLTTNRLKNIVHL